MAELMLSGCTTSSDHLYVFPNGCRLDDTVGAAKTSASAFTPLRRDGSRREPGRPAADALTEDEDAICAMRGA
jgi:hypothetical protein